MPMLKAERISCSGPKLSDAQTRNFEAIKHTHARVLVAAGICVLASLFDQTHKLFVPGREFDAGDLLFDLLGYSTAIAFVSLAWIIFRRLPLSKQFS